MKAPKNSVTRNDMTAIEQLELWKTYQDHWCEHKPSITVYVGDDEWMEVGAWVYKNISILSGVSFLPRDNGSYRQAPYEEINEEQYNELVKNQNLDINWIEFMEETDTTTSAKELACSAGVCEI
jgi:ribonucleoside-triphosphate reductase (thioredoxin)